ncbi:hypothetical protein SKAU_G00099940 [Synaphobranchus kaupii]|uniref:Uncharacterized protein n=1 Tax=Synaphobranchus kaupii TaxID=118154 RepID=A0A9Q1FZC9_SYNKA|nr:hypothetical protein SKAU_G00099940 [Synaphobranchus kaupii]
MLQSAKLLQDSRAIAAIAVQQELAVMVEMGVIECSISEWCSPIFLVPKKDRTLRFCIDFSHVNAISKFDPYPMPRLDDLIERLGKGECSRAGAGLESGEQAGEYWQRELGERWQEQTSRLVGTGRQDWSRFGT